MMIRQAELTRLQQTSEAVMAIERNGMGVDLAYAKTTLLRAQADADHVKSELAAIEPDVSFASPQQVSDLLYERLGLPVSPVCAKGEPKKGARPTDRVALEWLARRHPEHAEFIGKAIKLRQITSSIQQLDRLIRYTRPSGLIHTVAGKGAATGRLTLASPNLSAVSKDKRKDVYAVRKALRGGPGEILVVADQTQLEVVILAHLAIALFGESGRYLASFLAAGAPDLHSTNARGVFGTFLGRYHPDGRALSSIPVAEWKTDAFLTQLRDDIKAIWYGLNYGKGAYGFGRSVLDAVTGSPIGEDRANDLVNGLLDTQPAIREWQAFVMEDLMERGYTWTPGGRIFDLRELVRGDKYAVHKAYRKALNFPLQGGGSDIMAAVMVAVVGCKELAALGYKLCLLVHDELALRGPPQHEDRAKALLSYHMTETVKLHLPLRCSCNAAETYFDAK